MTSRLADDRTERFSELFREFTPSVRGFVRTMVAASDVEPVVQATFETAWAKLEVIPLLSQRAWLFGVARNHVRNHVRAERRRTLLVDALGSLRPVEQAGICHGVDSAELAPLLAAIQQLSTQDRELVQLVAWHEMEPFEIAVVLDISANNARVRIHRARKHLETLMQAELREGDR